MAKKQKAAGIGTRVCADEYTLLRLDHNSSSWRRSHDRDWRVYKTNKSHCGRVLGAKTIEGRRRVVLSVGGRIFAQAPAFVRQVTARGLRGATRLRRKGR